MAYKIHTSPIGKLIWCNINHPGETLSNTLAYSTGLVLSGEGHAKMLAILDEFKKNDLADPKVLKNPKFINPFVPNYAKNADGSKTAVPGEFIWKVKRNELKKTKSGEIVKADPPKILDAMGRVLTNAPEIRSGSEGRIYFDLYFYDKAGNVGIGSGFHGVQIKSLAADFTDDVEAIEGGWTPDQPAAAVGVPAGPVWTVDEDADPDDGDLSF